LLSGWRVYLSYPLWMPLFFSYLESVVFYKVGILTAFPWTVEAHFNQHYMPNESRRTNDRWQLVWCGWNSCIFKEILVWWRTSATLSHGGCASRIDQHIWMLCGPQDMLAISGAGQHVSEGDISIRRDMVGEIREMGYYSGGCWTCCYFAFFFTNTYRG